MKLIIDKHLKAFFKYFVLIEKTDENAFLLSQNNGKNILALLFRNNTFV